jgi:hypothetical protein
LKAIGKITSLITNSVDWQTVITMEISASPRELEKYMQKEKLSIEIKQFREKRSLDANAYYWLLVTKIARVLGVTNNYQHNQMLRDYGALEIVNGKLVDVLIPETVEAEEHLLEEAKYHLRTTNSTAFNTEGVFCRIYNLLKGSSSYNTKEMAELIDGVIKECKELDIETLPPHELERMKREWGIE